MDSEIINIIDAGARFGPHPSWTELFRSDLLSIHAFEPEEEEYNWLKDKYKNNSNYIINKLALGDKENLLDLNILKHKGQTSFFTPNLKSDWFETVRKEDAEIIETQKNIKLITAESYIDELIKKNLPIPRFIKTDTEGYDLSVIKGFGKYLIDIHAVRTEMHFQNVFKESPKFLELFSLLFENDFRLANFDYEGSGVQQSYFVPNKNNYGICTGTEGVFIRSNEYYLNLSDIDFVHVIAFLFCNKLEDYAISLLGKREKVFHNIQDTKLSKFIEKKFLLNIKKFENYSSEIFNMAKKDYGRFFSKPYPDGHNFYRYVNSI